MPKTVEILRDNLLEHPAVRAWNATGSVRVEPKAVAVIKRWGGHQKSGVYRLAGVGPDGAAVIAKRCPPVTAAVERPIYEEFLPRLPLPSLMYYGSVEETDGQSCWLFLEEADGELYSPLNAEHRALAGRWLATVHNTGWRLGWGKHLPDRGPGRYLQMLRTCRERVCDHFATPGLSSDAAAVLQTVNRQCDTLEEHWEEMETVCGDVPCTLTHGDLVVKNVRVRPGADGPELLVFDWEFAGWGVPSTDLTQHTGHTVSPDLITYRDCLDFRPVRCDDVQVQRLAECGRFFRLVGVMWWASFGLAFEQPEFLNEPISYLKSYSQRMARALGEAGWRTA